MLTKIVSAVLDATESPDELRRRARLFRRRSKLHFRRGLAYTREFVLALANVHSDITEPNMRFQRSFDGLKRRDAYASNDTTSAEAAASLSKPDLQALRQRIYTLIRTTGGSTCDEIEVTTGLAHQTASARVYDLAKAGIIVDSGEVRPTRSGRNAIIWKAADTDLIETPKIKRHRAPKDPVWLRDPEPESALPIVTPPKAISRTAPSKADLYQCSFLQWIGYETEGEFTDAPHAVPHDIKEIVRYVSGVITDDADRLRLLVPLFDAVQTATSRNVRFRRAAYALKCAYDVVKHHIPNAREFDFATMENVIAFEAYVCDLWERPNGSIRTLFNALETSGPTPGLFSLWTAAKHMKQAFTESRTTETTDMMLSVFVQSIRAMRACASVPDNELEVAMLRDWCCIR